MSTLGLSTALEEYRRRRNEERLRFNDSDGYELRPDLVKFHSSNAQERILLGGNRSSKTWASIVDAIWEASGQHPYRDVVKTRRRMVRHVAPDLTHSVYSRLLPEGYEVLVPRSWLRDGISFSGSYEKKAHRLNFAEREPFNGSFIEFMSYEMPVEAHQGAARDLILFDEEPPENIYKESRKRKGRGKNAPQAKIVTAATLLWAENSPGFITWMQDLVDSAEFDESVEVFYLKTADNLTEDQIVDMVRGLSEEEKRVVLYGDLVPLSGNVFHMLDTKSAQICEPINIMDSMYDNWKVAYAIDPHDKTPHHWLQIGISPDNWVYCLDEIAPTHQVLPEDFADMIKYKTDGLVLDAKVIDTYANKPSNEDGKTFKQRLQECGIRGLREARKSKDFSIFQDMNAALLNAKQEVNGKRLYITRNCPRLIWEMRKYVWDNYVRDMGRGVKQTPRKVDDHLIDCLRYLWNANLWFYDKGKRRGDKRVSKVNTWNVSKAKLEIPALR